MLTELSLPALLEELAAPHEAPGAGTALAVTLAAAAAVVQMAARLSPESWPEASGAAAQAESLLERAVKLVDEGAEAYARAIEARESAAAGGSAGSGQAQRDWALGRATAAAAEPPLALARTASDLAVLCAAASRSVEPRVHVDVAAAAALAAAVARGARELVAVNLTALPGDVRVEEVEGLAATAERAAAVAARTE